MRKQTVRALQPTLEIRFLCVKVGQETDYWLEMLADPTSDKENLETIQTECKELIYIFNKILKTMNEKYGNRSTH